MYSNFLTLSMPCSIIVEFWSSNIILNYRYWLEFLYLLCGDLKKNLKQRFLRQVFLNFIFFAEKYGICSNRK